MIKLFIWLFMILIILFMVGGIILNIETIKIQNELMQTKTRIEALYECRMDTLEATEQRIRTEALAKMIRNGKGWVDSGMWEIEKPKRRQ